MVRLERFTAFMVALTGLLAPFGTATLAQDLPAAPIPVVPSGPPPDGSAIAPPRGKSGSAGVTVAAPPYLPAPNSSPIPPGSPPPPPPPGPVVGTPPVLVPPPPPVPPPPLFQDGHWNDLANCPPVEPGLFGDIELDVVGPHIKNRLTENVTLAPGFVDTVHLPTASLDWTFSPRFELGYRLPGNGGEFTAAYRFLISDGQAFLPGFADGFGGTLKSNLNLEVVDLQYGAGWFSPAPYWDVKWRLGIRMVDVFFDSTACNEFLEQRTTNHFIGIGPLGSLEAWRRLDLPGLALVGKLEGSVPVGSIHQGFEEVLTLGPGNQIGGATSQRQTQAVPTLGLDLGVGWTPPWKHYVRFSTGYHLEQWWDLGLVNDSRANLTTQGLFFKGEFSY
jgi:hypothetical protein